MKRFILSLVLLVSSALLSPISVLADDTATKQSATTSAVVNINTAQVEELTMLQGIGEVKAEAIVAWRDKHGPFEDAEQLLEVSGVGEATFDDISEQIEL